MKKNKSNIKILIAYHKPATILHDEVFIPIHVGRAIANQQGKDGKASQADLEWLNANTIGDDSGDNISHLNHKFCELTAIYWAWKNYDKLGDPDYIGLMHYRRFMSFKREHVADKAYATFDCPYLDEETIEKFGLRAEFVHKIVDGSKIIVRQEKHQSTMIGKHADNYMNALNGEHHISDDFIQCFKYIEDNYPDMIPDLEAFKKNKKIHLSNMFIMQKNAFFEYCEWLFDILFALDAKFDYQFRSTNEYRALGFIAERLLDIYVRHLKRTKGIPYTELPIIYISKTDLISDPTPISLNKTAICFSCEDRYAHCLGVLIQSIIENSTDENIYDIIILHKNIASFKRQQLLNFVAQYKNIHLRFYNVGSLIKNLKFYLSGNTRETSYYKLFIPLIFKNFSKILYLDTPVIVLNDINKLLQKDISESYIAGVNDFGLFAEVKSGKNKNETYFIEKINPNFYSEYIQTDVVLFNIPKIIYDNVQKMFLSTISQSNSNYNAQDALNLICKGKIHILDARWNVLNDSGQRKGYMHCNPAQHYKTYLASRENPYIIHYVSRFKPWSHPSEDMAEIWWHYARKTPFYEEIFYENLQYTPQKPAKSKPSSPPSFRKRFESRALAIMPEWLARLVVPIYKYGFRKIKTLGSS